MLVLEKLNPCSSGLEFYKSQKDIFEAWNNCQRGDWMLWLAKKLDIDHRLLTLAKGKCAETVIHLMKDDRSKSAVKASIDYGNGLINLDFLHSAAAAAYAAADAADAAAAAAAYAAYADAYAAYAAAAARTKNRLDTANICREILTLAVFEKINNYK